MKTVYAILICFIPLLSPAKDACSKVKSIKDDVRGWTVWYSPLSMGAGIKRVKYVDGRDSMYFSITVTKQGIIDNKLDGLVKGAYIIFDNDAFRDYEAKVNIVPMGYPLPKSMYAANIPIDSSLLNKMRAGTVKKVAVSGFGRELTSNESKELMKYFECISAK